MSPAPCNPTSVQIILLTHERELERPTNTGKLALEGDTGAAIRRLVWQRTAPDPGLLETLQQPGCGLVYPQSEMSGEAASALSLEECETFVLLDGTWQEARKMFNRSPYLKPLPSVELAAERPSQFTLRRNQRDGGLCTVECIIEILRAKGRADMAGGLEARFLAFLGR